MDTLVAKNALSIRNLTKVYANGKKAVNNISFDVAQGDFFALLGPNGAGKSTTIGIMSSLVNKTSGTVKVFDINLEYNPTVAKSLIGLVPQEFNFNIFEQISDVLITQAGYYGVSKRLALPRIEKYLKKLDLWEDRHMRIRFLSGGMKRRLLIARALIHEPQLLVLDEPTAGVDIELRRLLWDFLAKLNQSGTTIILTTHYLEEAEQLCRHIGIIHHGQLIENDSMKNLLQKLYQETFVLYLTSPLESNTIEKLSVFNIVYKVIDAYTLEVDLSHQQTFTELYQKLNSLGIVIKTLRNKVNRLEELFLRLTQNKIIEGEK